MNEWMEYVVFYEDMKFYFPEIDFDPPRLFLDSFSTCNPRIRVLGEYISGGIKVDDSLSRLQSIDFANTAYGKHRAEKALKTSTMPYNEFSYEMHYVAFEEEGQVSLTV